MGPPPTGRSPAKGGGGMDAASVKAAFDAFDIDRSGDIDEKELRGALKKLGMDVNARDTEAVLRRYVTGGKQTLSVHDFAKLVNDLRDFQGGSTTPIDRTKHARSQIDPKITAAFEAFDTDRSGGIDEKELLRALLQLGMQATAASAREVMRKYDTVNNDGTLDIFEFDRLVRDLNAFRGGAPIGSGGGGGRVEPRIQAPGSRASGGSAYVSPGKIDPRVRSAFERFDTDRNGSIDARELRSALHHLGMEADSEQSGRVLSRYDTDHSGGIELREFASLVADLIEHQVGGGAQDHEVRKAFATFDHDRSGTIDARELTHALQVLGIEASSAQAGAILRQYDADGNRTLDLNEFARLVRDIRDFQEGGRRDAISAQLKRKDIIALFSQHRLALDELFRAYAAFAITVDPTPP